MKVAFFSTHSYDKEYFERFNQQHDIIFYEATLNIHTVNLATDCNAVCVFVNDQLNAAVIKSLAVTGIKIIALRCAGFNNVDLTAAEIGRASCRERV